MNGKIYGLYSPPCCGNSGEFQKIIVNTKSTIHHQPAIPATLMIFPFSFHSA
jgi:hypothetical protein